MKILINTIDKKSWLIVCLASISFAGFSSDAQAATKIYRSVSPGATTALATGASNPANINGDLVEFASDLPDTVGVGDVIQYDSDNNGTADSVAFIIDVSSRKEFDIQAADGNDPPHLLTDSDWSIFRAYTSLANAENGIENTGLYDAVENFDNFTGGKDISQSTGDDEAWYFLCYANGTTADTSPVTFNGWTTEDASNTIKVYTPSDDDETAVNQRHRGVWDDSKYHLVVTTDGQSAVSIQIPNIILDGLQIAKSDTLSAKEVINLFDVPGKVTLTELLITRAHAGDSTGYGIYINGATTGGMVYAYNNIIYETDGGGIFGSFSSYNIIAYNNTVYCQSGMNAGFNNAGVNSFTVKNNIAQNCFVSYSGSYSAGSDYNIGDNGASVPGAHSKNATTVLFEDSSNDDYHLSPVDTAAREAGTFLSGDADLPFPLDVDHTQRGDAPWDIGADEADVTPPTVVVVHTGKTDGTYGAGEVIDIDVSFSENVNSSGPVTVTLETGTTDRTCSFTVVNDSFGTCNYTVQAGDSSADLAVLLISGIVADIDGNFMMDFTPATNLSAGHSIVINTPISVPTPVDTDSYIPNININGTVSALSSQSRFYQRSTTVAFTGKHSAAAGGKVKVYRKSKLMKKAVVDGSGNWSASVKGLKNKANSFRFVYLSSAGAILHSTGNYQVFIDTIKPKITNRASVRTSAGASLRTRTKDKTPITEYTYTFDGVATVSSSPTFTIPASAGSGNHTLTVRVKDSAGNYSPTKRIRVRVR